MSFVVVINAGVKTCTLQWIFPEDQEARICHLVKSQIRGYTLVDLEGATYAVLRTLFHIHMNLL